MGGKRLVIELDEEDYEVLKQMAIYRGISMQKIAENAVKSYLYQCVAEREICEWLKEMGKTMGRRPNEIITYILERYMEVYKVAREIKWASASTEQMIYEQPGGGDAEP
jgi:uncharacterized protein (DUF885 family)